MPTIPLTTLDNRTGKRTVLWSNASTANNFAAYSPDRAMAVASITIVSAAAGGAIFSLLVSNDGINYSPLKDVNGADITVAGTYDISTAAATIKPTLAGGTADDWSASLTYWG